MSAEDRRKAFAHRTQQLLNDHFRALRCRAENDHVPDLRPRIVSALEDAYQMGVRTGRGEEQEAVRQIVEKES